VSELIVQTEKGFYKTIKLKPGVLGVGKSDENALVLNIPGISRNHLQIITAADGTAVVKDLGSRNGTWLNQDRLLGQAILDDGAIIKLGMVSLIFKFISLNSRQDCVPKPQKKGETISAEMRKKIHKELLSSLDLKRLDLTNLSDSQLRHTTESAVRDIVTKHQDLSLQIDKEDLIKIITDEAVGLGPLEALLVDDSVSEIMVNRANQIYVERNGNLELTDVSFTDDRTVIEIIRRIIAPLGRRIDESSPMVDARLQDGSRVNAIIPPLAISGPCITIRKFSKEPFTIDDLIDFGSMTKQMAEFLRLCVKYRKNICISGGTGSGKTTLLNVISGFIPSDERIVTIEDAAELRLPQEHVISLETKPANIEGEGAISIRKLVINSLRMRPDRIVVGECRGGEALDMLQAMNTGHDGSLTTLHANSCRDALARLETLVLMAGMDLPAKAIRDQVASAIDIILQTSRLSDGTRRVTSISTIEGIEGETILLQEVYKYQQDGYDKDGKIIGDFKATGTIPPFIHDLTSRGIDVELSMFR